MAEISPAEAPSRQHAALGSTVWYMHPSHVWLRATVVDGVPPEENGGAVAKYAPAKTGARHLRVEFDPNNGGSYRPTGTYGYRLDVPEGTEPGCWQVQPPKDWEQARAEYEMRKQMQKEERLRVWSA